MTSTYTVSDLQLAQAKLLGIRDPKRNCEGAWADRLRWAVGCLQRKDRDALRVAVDDANTCAVRS